LTESGHDFYQRCKDIKDNVDEAINFVNTKQLEPIGTLRISIPPIFGQYALLPIIFDFMRCYPKIKIQCSLQSIRNIIVDDSDYDLMIVATQELPDSNYQARLLTRYQGLKVCAAPQYFASHTRPKKPQDLLQHNCLVYAVMGEYYDKWQFNYEGKDEYLCVQGDFQINSSICLLEAALAGRGIVYLPNVIVDSYISKGKLESVLDKYIVKDTKFYALYHKNRYLTPKVRLFIDTVIQQLPARLS
jgi:DNA-binding transcriptional LysR family regulator